MVQRVINAEDFNFILDNYFGREITRVPVTQGTSNISGQETLTDGTPDEIKAYYLRRNQTWDYKKEGFLEQGDAVLLSKIDDAVKINHKIYADGTKLTISSIDGDATTITVDTSTDHGLSVGNKVIIQETTNYDGVYTVATITDSDTFTIEDTTHDLDAETSGYVIKDYLKFRVKEAFDVPGVFDSTGAGTTLIYTYSNLFIISEDDE